MEACELLAIEVRLDRIEAELAIELPPHMRAFARAHAGGTAVPPAPEVVYRAATLATARAALVHPVLADRGLALLRIAAPTAIERAPGVAAARVAAPTWQALAALASAREVDARAQHGVGAIALMHLLHGSALSGDAIAAIAGAPAADPVGSEPPTAVPPAIPGWFDGDGGALDDRALARRWDTLRAHHGVAGRVEFVRGRGVRPRAFVVVPGREVIVVVPARIAAPDERFAVLHELGHAVAALAGPAGIPRVIDEAVAAYVARAIEDTDDPWYSPLAAAARVRRRALAQRLARIERALPGLPDVPLISERPPWALWHDPGAQAAYVAAEAIADAIARALDTAPAPGVLANVIAAACAAIDRPASALLAR